MGCAPHRIGRAGKALLAAGVMIASLAMAVAFASPASTRVSIGNSFGSIVSSQYVVDDNITISNYTAPRFTWSEPVLFTFTVDSNVTGIVTLTINCSALAPFISNINVSGGLKPVNITLGVNPMALPGNYVANITFDHAGGNSTSFIHEIWVGSNIIISYGILFGTLGFCIAIYAIVGAPKKPKASTPGTSGAAASASDDDTSTVTYVDQSQAPPGRIYCPECKKVIEEGSIFCPECGTRIPRYLRYHP